MKKIKGAKMFQEELNLLKLYRKEYNFTNECNQMTASMIACNILMHFVCDDLGQILASEFNLKETTEKYNLPYSSIHKAMHALFDMGFLKSVYIQNNEYYVLNGYQELNSPEKNGALNYFYIPQSFLISGTLSSFIRSRDIDGLIGALDLLNGLSRQYQKNKKEKQLFRNVSALLEKMQKTTRNIGAWLQRIKDFFIVEIEKDKYISKAKITVDLPDNCFNDVSDAEQLSFYASIRKELRSVTLQHDLFIKQKEFSDAYYATLQDLGSVFFRSRNAKLHVSTVIREATHRTAEAVTLSKTSSPIQNPIGFWRQKVRQQTIATIQSLDLSDYLAIKTNAINHKQDIPPYLLQTLFE